MQPWPRFGPGVDWTLPTSDSDHFQCFSRADMCRDVKSTLPYKSEQPAGNHNGWMHLAVQRHKIDILKGNRSLRQR